MSVREGEPQLHLLQGRPFRKGFPQALDFPLLMADHTPARAAKKAALKPNEADLQPYNSYLKPDRADLESYTISLNPMQDPQI